MRSASPTTTAAPATSSNVIIRASAASFCSRTHAPHDVGEHDRPERRGLERARLVVGEQVLDQLLQRQRVLAHDAHDVAAARGDSSPADVVAQELGALAHRGERRLELVRDVAQEARLLLLELGQARAQPFEPLPEVAQVLRAVDVRSPA